MKIQLNKERVAFHMALHRITSIELAARLGLSAATVSTLRGGRAASAWTCWKLAVALRSTIADLVAARCLAQVRRELSRIDDAIIEESEKGAKKS